MIAIRVTEESKHVIALMNDGVVPEPELVASYFVCDELGIDPPTIMDIQEFRSLQAKLNMRHSMIIVWNTV